MQTLIDSLPVYIRINKEDSNFEKIDLNNIVDEIIMMLKEDISEKRASIKVETLRSKRYLYSISTAHLSPFE